MKTLHDKLSEFSVEEQKEIKEIAEEMILESGLQKIREELQLSQKTLADTMGVSQPAITQIEQRGNEVKLATLKRYIEAMGGKLSLNVELPTGNGRIFHI
ncbi:helix-turn-helix domain-containing protein [Salmonella enterica]|uniref:Helix-turn-helix domain-containing protein n=1 Tax=Salmonella enterica TaxID=28901 RepID=A0A624QMN1_SALER|nr:helix-turn-helix domain-containing protein [Salmonella enterica]ELE3269929.1 XRE family transcriptional regulator [Salmonella enterica subsp. enterica serovar Muenchen]EAZ4079936.1 helix-turn-helix domain-containing protein [Salmonella enterica]ECZ6618858.1 helix-turn-helix domain-containing protein [Salmonella enterica]EDQ2076336.1 helix-turn-helix domain-containing protein [Salmonella enterica]